MSIRFGFLTESISLAWTGGHIESLPEQQAIVKGVADSSHHYSGWIYPPKCAVHSDTKETKAPPEVATPFATPSTHCLILSSGNSDPAAENFYIALFGMLKGLRLQRQGWKHFYKCPTKRGTLCDFYASNGEIIRTLDIAENFWHQFSDPAIRQLAFSTIHWHLFAQLYEHEFERFNAQYTAFDACWKLATLTLSATANGHAERPRALATLLNLQIPTWALPVATGRNSCSLSVRRNALVHEATYANEPLGFAHPTTDPRMALELQNFVSRCIFGLIGVQNEYTRSPVDSRQVFGFSY